MNILAFDSTAVAASAAVAKDDKVITCFTADNGLTHSEILLPMGENVLEKAGLTLPDIQLFAVTRGPGSFTGVRIGVATVKGLAFAGGKPCCGISTLEALAENIATLPGILCPVMDARRAQVYNALFAGGTDCPRRLCEDRALSLSELAAELRERYAGETIWLVGDGYLIAREALIAAGVTGIGDTPVGMRLQNAGSVARCAYRAYQRGETVCDRDLTPLYLRLPQAERDRLTKAKE